MKKTKTIKRIKIGKVGEAILGGIAVVGVVGFFAIFPGMGCVIAPFIKKKRFPKKQSIERSVESLVSTGLVKKYFDTNGDVKLELTAKGKWEVFMRHPSFDKKVEKWDGVWRVVIFDVPELQKEIRNELRRAMLLYGFKMLQQSVWVYPHSCDDFVVVLKNHLEIPQNVLYMTVSYIENDKHLKKEFGL